jgi:hypothetical protein
MKREDKIKKRKERRLERILKRHKKDSKYKIISDGRRLLNGRIFECELGSETCTQRGYCNGDC